MWGRSQWAEPEALGSHPSSAVGLEHPSMTSPASCCCCLFSLHWSCSVCFLIFKNLPVGEARTGRLGLAGANYYTENGWTVRSCCVVQGPGFDVPRYTIKERLPRRSGGWESALQCRRPGFDPWPGTKIPHPMEQLSLGARAVEPVHPRARPLESTCHNARAHLMQRKPRVPQLGPQAAQ